MQTHALQNDTSSLKWRQRFYILAQYGFQGWVMRCMQALIALIGLMIMTGCALKEAPLAAQEAELPIAQRWTAADEADPGLVDEGWLANFEDQRLEHLVAEALQSNRDLQAAAARVDEAEARVRRAGAGLRPQIGIGAGAAREGSGGDTGHSVNLGLEVSWELDVWGRIRSQQEAEALDAIATAAIFEYARQSLAAEVSEAWFFTTGNKLKVAIEQDILTLQQSTFDIVEAKHREGVASTLERNVARSDVARAQEILTRSQGALEDAVRSLEVLLGRYPSAELAVADALPKMPGLVPIGLPSELLERRPDIVARDRRVAAAFNRTASAKAARLPRIALTGGVGGASSALGSMSSPLNAAWSVGANLLAPLYQGGQLQAEVDISTAQQKQALAEYAAAGLRAFQEVETALSNEEVLRQREAQLLAVIRDLEQATEVAQLRYNAGKLSLLDLTQVKQQFYTARRDLLQVQIERLRQRVNLHLSLGGSFESASAPERNLSQHP
jgi:NodT family efflux transporter outer membrane factor (OMF) lipoprotein